jgi:hypothetical protein
MPTPQEPNHGAVPTSSSRNGHANKRMFAIAAAVVAGAAGHRLRRGPGRGGLIRAGGRP